MNKKKIQYTSNIKIPENITITSNNNYLIFCGPLGQSCLNLHKMDLAGFGAISILSEKKIIKLITSSKSFHGLIKKLILNKIQGVSRGFLLYLKILGIGYRVSLQNNTLFFKLGYSHDILYKLPSSIKVFLVDSTSFCLFGIDKNQITQISAKIRSLRSPSVYKGKGIRLLDENIILKIGKRK